MLIYFFTLLIFIPYKIRKPEVLTVNTLSEMEKVIHSTTFSVVLHIDSQDSASPLLKDQFIRASSLFNHNGSFCIIDSSKSESQLRKYGQQAPCLVLFKQKREWLILPYPRNEDSLLFLFNHFFSQKLVTMNNRADFLSCFGHFDFTLLTPPELVQQVMSLRFQISAYVGNMEILVCDKKFLQQSFTIKNNEIGIYRAEDQTIQSIQPNIDSIFEATIPVFRHFVTTDFRQPDSTFVAFLGTQQDSNLKDVDELLFNLSIKFPNFVIGYLEPKLQYIARHATMQKFDNLPTIITFSPSDRSYFPINDPKLFNLPFNKEQWMKDAELYLSMINKGKIKRKYHSEPVPKNNKNDLVEKIVGDTYDSFMKDQRHDLYVMYVESNNGVCNEALSEFQKAAEVARNIRFGVIDVILNSSPRKFPQIHKLPYVRFYPSKNRTNDVPFLHSMKRDDFLRFAMKFGSQNYKFDVPKKSKSEFRNEISIFNKIISQLPPDDQNKMEPYFKKMWFEVGLKSGISRPDDEDEL
ncbi:hypothetical protein TRFO_16861 [Tritrichomonas foetus]|uniref:Thioredoxin domain-containing protein n=1 Tax=Tritrichomonas foetus TaxID=1144522 RepID=A0A1J4KPE3_9EUKA|nr:hypothetical protein TRFO_16861 [Tritrichomonas foetus]|eukprot:OHT13107.1 hypothetical protein TRFO_16861 [Tritrichomonas foetus]